MSRLLLTVDLAPIVPCNFVVLKSKLHHAAILVLSFLNLV